MQERKVRIIEIQWQRDKDIEKLIKKGKNTRREDYGLYQIYGSHFIYGRDQLLYIGRARDISFIHRFFSHSQWLKFESDIKVYTGYLGGENGNEMISKIPKDTSSEDLKKKWNKMIDIAEANLIYYCSPPYNSSNIGDLNDNWKDVLIYNHGNKGVLPFVVSNIYQQSSYYSGSIYGRGEKSEKRDLDNLPETKWKRFEWSNNK